MLRLIRLLLHQMQMYHAESSVGNSTRSDGTLIDAHTWILKEMIRRDIGPMGKSNGNSFLSIYSLESVQYARMSVG